MSSEHDLNPDAALRRRLLGALGAAGLGALAPWQGTLAQAGKWPERPINYVVPFPPGGLTDVAARQVGKALGDAEHWNVVVENRPGGNANIGATHVANAAPDGYTWLAITLSHAANATLFAGKAGYDLTRDLTPLAGLASSPIMVVVNAKSDIKNMADLARAARAKSLSAGSSGNGTPPHLTLALYQKLTGLPLMHIPYKGGAPSLTDLIGGHLDVVFSNYPESLSHVKNGSLRAPPAAREGFSTPLLTTSSAVLPAWPVRAATGSGLVARRGRSRVRRPSRLRRSSSIRHSSSPPIRCRTRPRPMMTASSTRPRREDTTSATAACSLLWTRA